MPPAVTGETMPAASPTSSARLAATGRTTPPQGIMPARTDEGRRPRKSHSGAIFSSNAAIAAPACEASPRTRRADLHKPDAGNRPRDVAGGQPPIDKTVELLRLRDFHVFVLVLEAEQKFTAPAEPQRARDRGAGTVGADEKAGRAQLAEVEAAAAALRFGERFSIENARAGLF